MKNKSYVFISYSRTDQAIVNRLSSDLRARDVEVWVDVEQIAAGTRWVTEIERGLEGAQALIFVISKASLQSEWMNVELKAFIRDRKSVFPILIEDVNLEEIPVFISSIQWIDFRQSYEKGLEILAEVLGAPKKPVSPTTSVPKKTKGYVFLSYAEEDRDFVESLVEFLRQRGYSYWDYEESDRDYHNQLFLELESVIREASATLSVLSESWKRSPWTVREYFFAQEVGVPVFLLRAKNIGPTLAVAGIPYIDFTKNKDAGFNKLDRELKRKDL